MTLSNDWVGSTLTHWATHQSQQPALICGDTRLDWSALAARVENGSRRLAEAQKTIAHSRQPAVGLELPNPLNMVIAFLASVRAGFRAQVFDPSWTLAQRQEMQRAAKPDLMVTEATLSHWLSRPGGTGSDHALPDLDPKTPFYVGFTSGSTGLPKGYRRSHDSWLASFALSEQLFDWHAGDVVMAPGSLATSLHLYGVIHALQMGRIVVLVPRFQPRRILNAMAQYRVSACYATPTQVQLLLQTAQRAGSTTNRQLRHWIISGAKWRESTRDQLRRTFPVATLTEFYGTSETSFIALHNDQTRAPVGSVGRPVPGVSVCIGPTIEQPLPPGERGRIWIRSRLLFEGYECGGGDEIQRDRGWLTVGDHGYLDEAGYLYLVGREKRMLVSSGQNLYPEEVEAWLMQHPGVAQAALFGLPDPLRGQRIVAAVQPAFDQLTVQPLRDHCHQRFPVSQVPREWYRVTDWPLTGSGKTDLPVLELLVHKLAQQSVGHAGERFS